MRAGHVRCLLWALALPIVAGCAQNPYAVQGQVNTLKQQQTTLAQQNEQLQSRAATLDQDNQQLETYLAQARQQNRLLTDQITVVREQLDATVKQLTQVREEKSVVEKKVESSLASSKTRASATITANSSLRRNLPVIDIPGVEVRQDGDVVRIELPADRLFDASGVRLRAEAAQWIEAAAAEIERTSPGQYVGVEGHTDNSPPPSGSYMSPHQYTVAQATVVFDYLTTRTRLRPNQLFLVGHGNNHPVVSNATAAGKTRNRRVELVVYPERVGG